MLLAQCHCQGITLHMYCLLAVSVPGRAVWEYKSHRVVSNVQSSYHSIILSTHINPLWKRHTINLKFVQSARKVIGPSPEKSITNRITLTCNQNHRGMDWNKSCRALKNNTNRKSRVGHGVKKQAPKKPKKRKKKGKIHLPVSLMAQLSRLKLRCHYLSALNTPP